MVGLDVVGVELQHVHGAVPLHEPAVGVEHEATQLTGEGPVLVPRPGVAPVDHLPDLPDRVRLRQRHDHGPAGCPVGDAHLVSSAPGARPIGVHAAARGDAGPTHEGRVVLRHAAPLPVPLDEGAGGPGAVVVDGRTALELQTTLGVVHRHRRLPVHQRHHADVLGVHVHPVELPRGPGPRPLQQRAVGGEQELSHGVRVRLVVGPGRSGVPLEPLHDLPLRRRPCLLRHHRRTETGHSNQHRQHARNPHHAVHRIPLVWGFERTGPRHACDTDRATYLCPCPLGVKRLPTPPTTRGAQLTSRTRVGTPRHGAPQMGALGLEPRTYGLKIRCSTD